MSELHPLDVSLWYNCYEHETPYRKDSYCKDCRIAELEAVIADVECELLARDTRRKDTKTIGNIIAAIKRVK